jgi:hypothetical protein
MDKSLPGKEWTAEGGKDLDISEEYAEIIRRLQYKIMVFIGRKPFEFQCVAFEPKSGGYKFTDVVIDTSKHDAKGTATMERISYHPYVELVNAPFMVIPLDSELPVD